MRNKKQAFIEGILSGRIKKVTDEKQVEADLFEQMMDWETFTGHNKLIEFFVGCEVYNAPEEEKEAARKKMQGLSVLQKLLCLVSAMVADADLVEWNYTYNTVKGKKVQSSMKRGQIYYGRSNYREEGSEQRGGRPANYTMC